MKKFNYSRIIILVLSLALLIGAAFAVTANAEEAVETPATLFKGISVAYGDNVAISVKVDATQEEIETGAVRVTYTLGEDSTEYDAKYYYTDANNVVWVRTSGIEAYKLAQVVKFNSYLGETKVDTEKAYSVAQFLYTMLYTQDLSEVEENLYNALLTYGEATQKWYNAKNDLDLPLVTASSLVYTNNANVKVNGNGKVFAPAGAVNVNVEYVPGENDPSDITAIGWIIRDGEGEKRVATLDASYSGVVEIICPVLSSKYLAANGSFEFGLEGWNSVGEIGVVTKADTYWGQQIPYGKHGDYLFTGVESNGDDTMREGNKGTLTSSAFEIAGTGYISFMLGGGGNELCYVQVVDVNTGDVLARYHQQEMKENSVDPTYDGTLVQYVADLSAHMGKTAIIQVVDYATSGWGCVSFDNVVTYYKDANYLPEGITANNIFNGTYEITNGSFENGMEGWNELVNIGEVVKDEIPDDWYDKNDSNARDGEYLYSFAYKNDNGETVNLEGAQGTLESSRFTLKSGSYVSFRFGAGGGTAAYRVNPDVYIELVRVDGTVIAKFHNDADVKNRTTMNKYCYQYTGETAECFFRVCDYSDHDYGCVVVDDFRVNLDSAPDGYIKK